MLDPEKFAAALVLVWFAALALVCRTVESDPKALAMARAMDPDLYKFPAVAFATAMFLGMVDAASGFAGNKSKKLAIIPFAQNAIACSAYITFAWPDAWFSSPVLLDFGGRLLRPTHLLEWAFTTPAMLFLLGQMCEVAPGKLASYMAAAVLNIAFGFLASWCHAPVLVVLFVTIAFGFFFWVQHGFWSMYQSNIVKAAKAGDEVLKYSIVWVRALTLVLWNVFGVLWLLGAANLVSVETNEILLSVADFVTKSQQV